MRAQAPARWIVGVIILGLLPGLALAQSPGELDFSFGGDGKVITDFGAEFPKDEVHALALQPDGKIIAAGQGNSNFALARYKTDGSLDQTFDNDGKVITGFPGASESIAYALAVQPNGKILAAGTDYHNFALVRYHPNGALDTAFGDNGRLTTNLGADQCVAHALALQPDGKILVAGFNLNTTSYKRDFALVRYNPNGSLDPTFDKDGKLTTDFNNDASDTAVALALQADGKIVVAGSTDKNNDNDFALARYNSNGSLDPTFEGDGRVITSFGPSFEWFTDLVLQPDGKIVAGGSTRVHLGVGIVLARYNPDGSLDPNFDGDGFSIRDSSLTGLSALALQPDSKLVAAGVGAPPIFNGDIALARYYNNGSLDLTFGNNGSLKTDIEGGSDDYAFDLIIQPDNKLVVGGYTGSDFVLVRYFAPNPHLGPIRAYLPLVLKR